MKYIIYILLLLTLIYSSIQQCSVLPKEQYGVEQVVNVSIDYWLIKHNNVKMNVDSKVNLKPSDTLVGIVDYCSVMDTRLDATFYSAIISLDVTHHKTNNLVLCFREFFDHSTDSIQTKVMEDSHSCVASSISDGKVEFQVKDILRYMFTRPVGTLSLFTIETLSDHPSHHVHFNLSTGEGLELIIPSIPIPPLMPDTVSEDGNDYQHLFPGFDFYHVCTIPDSELQNGYTNPSYRCYGRDTYVKRASKTNPLGPCVEVYFDGMPTEGAMHHSHVNNHVSLPGESPYNPHDYCDVFISTRLGSGTNYPTPPIDAWNWNLENQRRENAQYLKWIRSLNPDAFISVYTHDRDSIAIQFNSIPDLMLEWDNKAGYEYHIPVQHNLTVFWDSWFSVCKDEEHIDGVCSEYTLGNGFPASYKPTPACDLGFQFGLVSNISECTCNDNLFLMPFIGEFCESRFIHREQFSGYRGCMWGRYGYEDNYQYYSGMDDPNSNFRKCAANWTDPFTGEEVPFVGFLFDMRLQLGGVVDPAYDFNTCTPIDTGFFSTFNPQFATFSTVLPPEELAIFSFGAECEIRFNYSEEMLQHCLLRREFKSLDPQGATFNTELYIREVFPQINETGVSMFYRANQAIKNGLAGTKIAVFHSGPGGMLNPNPDPDYVRLFVDEVVEGRYYHSHFFVVDNPYAFNLRHLHLTKKLGVIPDYVTI